MPKTAKGRASSTANQVTARRLSSRLASAVPVPSRLPKLFPASPNARRPAKLVSISRSPFARKIQERPRAAQKLSRPRAPAACSYRYLTLIFQPPDQPLAVLAIIGLLEWKRDSGIGFGFAPNPMPKPSVPSTTFRRSSWLGRPPPSAKFASAWKSPATLLRKSEPDFRRPRRRRLRIWRNLNTTFGLRALQDRA